MVPPPRTSVPEHPSAPRRTLPHPTAPHRTPPHLTAPHRTSPHPGMRNRVFEMFIEIDDRHRVFEVVIEIEFSARP